MINTRIISIFSHLSEKLPLCSFLFFFMYKSNSYFFVIYSQIGCRIKETVTITSD